MTPKLNAAGYLLILLFSFARGSLRRRVQIDTHDQLHPWSGQGSHTPDLSNNVTFQHYQRRQSSNLTLTDYTAVVVFGASYCDDAHVRPEKYSDTLRGSPYWKGRYTNGPVFSEHLASGVLTGKKITQLNYAYGKATVSNALISAAAPDLATQIASYTHDVAHKLVDMSRANDGRVLHIFWTGTNDVIQIWQDAITNGTFAKLGSWSSTSNIPDRSEEEFETARQRIDAESMALISQVAGIRAHDRVNEVPSDILVLTLPPLETVPNLYYQSIELASNNPSTDVDNASLAKTYLRYMGELTAHYNRGIIKGMGDLVAQESSTAAVLTTPQRPLFMKTFDTVGFWNYVHRHPSEMGFENVSDACWNSTTGGVCTHPDRFEYWDTLHPTTAMHKLLAQELTTACNI